MITVSYEIPPITYNRNPILLHLQSNNFKIANGSYSQNWFTISPVINFPVNSTVSFSFAYQTLTFTLKVSPNNSGNELPTKLSGETQLAYANRLVTFFKKNYLLGSNYNITVSSSGGNPIIVFAARNFGVKYDFTNLVHVSVPTGQGFLFTLAGSGSEPQFRPNFKILLQVRLGTKILGEELLSIDDLGRTKVDLKEYFGYNAYHAFDTTTAFFHNPTFLQDFSFGVAEVYGEPEAAYEFTLYEGYQLMPGSYLDADFRRRLIANQSSWNIYRLTHIEINKFITSHKGNKVTYRNCYEKLTFIANGNIDVDVNILYTDGSNHIENIGSVSAAQNQVWEINASAETLQLSAINPSKDIASYTFEIKSSSILLDSFTYVYSHDKPLYLRQYAFVSQLGNWDYLTTTGGQTIVPAQEQELLLSVSSNDYFQAEKFRKINKTNTSVNIVGRTGYLNPEDVELYQAFISSPIVFEIIDGQQYSVGVLSGFAAKDENTDSEFLHAFQFEYTRDMTSLRSILCDDQFPNHINTMSETLVGCWGNLPKQLETPLLADDNSPLMTDNDNQILID